MCLEACPTYKELRVEADSPRGRLYLIRGLVERKLEPTPGVVAHLDRCLDCRACETACPSTVKYGEILEKTRTILQPERALSPAAALTRWLAFRVLLPSRFAQAVAMKLLWLAQALGLARVAAFLGGRCLLPRRFAAALAALAAPPAVPFRSFRARQKAAVFPARGTRRLRVALFTGCVADHLFADVNDATVRVLTENGCEVEIVAGERCCGALHIHNGARDRARALARDNVRTFEAGGFDAVVSNAAGCGAELRHYGALLPGDAAAASFGARVRDVAELLCELGIRPPPPPQGPERRVAYDEPCHLLHAQKISEPPKQLLRAIGGLTLVHLEDADACCGGAGAYFLQQPGLSAQITARKLDAIRRSGAEVVATGNPGCLMQIGNAVRAARLPIRVAHPVVLLAEAYARRS
jgi:glycolate oxidase iron-sulfur subunit